MLESKSNGKINLDIFNLRLPSFGTASLLKMHKARRLLPFTQGFVSWYNQLLQLEVELLIHFRVSKKALN